MSFDLKGIKSEPKLLSLFVSTNKIVWSKASINVNFISTLIDNTTIDCDTSLFYYCLLTVFVHAS